MSPSPAPARAAARPRPRPALVLAAALALILVVAMTIGMLPSTALQPTASAATATCATTDTCSFYLVNSWRGGTADDTVAMAGSPASTPVTGDWEGDGADSVGLRTASTYVLQSANATCASATTLAYGYASDSVLVGDWDGNGTDTLAVRRGSTYYLSNRLSGGQADRTFAYGRAGDGVLVGDWDGDGVDTLAVRRGATFYLSNRLSGGEADVVLTYGDAGDEVLVGDWDGDGVDTLAVRRGSDWYMRNDLRTGIAQQVVAYGRAADTALVGDWDGDGKDTPGVFRGARSSVGCTTGAVPSGADFHAGSIISDAEFFTPGSMSAADIRGWLSDRNPSCTAGPDGSACLQDYRATTTTMDTAYCAPYAGATNEDAASIIAKASTACGINPKVLLVILQKEQGLVLGTGSGLTATRYARATGFQCPDNSACDATYAGLPSQLYYAASRLVQYGAQPASFRYRAGGTYSIAYNPNAACGFSTVTIANRATAALYNYTPYQPNAAALANLAGAGDSCSSYGNRNFWRYYRTWFGSTGV